MPKPRGQITDSIEVAIERARELPDADINVPLLEAVRDGKLTPAEAGAKREEQLVARGRIHGS